jgi:hypothetical protein
VGISSALTGSLTAGAAQENKTPQKIIIFFGSPPKIHRSHSTGNRDNNNKNTVNAYWKEKLS